MSSEVDKNEKRRLSVEKARGQTGDDVNPEDLGIYVTCRRGTKAKSLPNQDSWSVLKTDRFILYGVYDGHGRKGHDVSNFVKLNLPRLIENDPRFGVDSIAERRQMLKDTFADMDSLLFKATAEKEIEATSAGTTTTVVIHDLQEQRLTVAHVGDSGAALARGLSNETIYLTPDHKPGLLKERERIEEAGGEVVYDGYNHRVYKVGQHYPALNMSRAFGDIRGKDAGISSVPDIVDIQLLAEDKFFMLCSDGVWEFMDPQEASNVCARALEQNGNPAKDLAVDALERWRENADGVVDDITVVFANLSQINSAYKRSVEMRSSNGKGEASAEEDFSVEDDIPAPSTLRTPASRCWRSQPL